MRAPGMLRPAFARRLPLSAVLCLAAAVTAGRAAAQQVAGEDTPLQVAASPPAAVAAPVSGTGPAPEKRPAFCFAVTGARCLTVLALDLGMAVGTNLHGDDLQIAGRLYASAGPLSAVTEALQVGPMLDVAVDVSGNERDDKAIGWQVAAKVASRWRLGDNWSLLATAGPSFLRTFHGLGSDTRAGALSELAFTAGEVTFGLAHEQLFDPGGDGAVQLRSYLLLRASACGWASGLSYGAIRCR
jgi:hypothetical protein